VRGGGGGERRVMGEDWIEVYGGRRPLVPPRVRRE
jgi:hypothetical protein